MYKVLEKEVELYAAKTLDEAMVFAKTHEGFVTIAGEGMEIVGRFGADSIKNGRCPDGVAYDWMKRRTQ